MPISISEMTANVQPDLIVVDGRNQHAYALAEIERLRIAAPSVAIFMVAVEANPDLILQAMRAGANE